jgi:hypothetical protein
MDAQRFFVPGKGYGEPSENAYEELARTFEANVTDKRISGLDWRHNGMKMSCEVDSPLPDYFQTEEEPVLVIFDRGDHFIICTQSRGGSNRSPVFAEKAKRPRVRYFTEG